MSRGRILPFRPLAGPTYELADNHRGLARKLAARFFRRQPNVLTFPEMFSEAYDALVYAAGKFEESRGVPFGAYATMTITHRLIRVVADRKASWGRGELSMSVVYNPVSGEPFDPFCYRSADPGRVAEAAELVSRVEAALPRRWFEMLWSVKVEGRTLKEAGEFFGVTRQRVRQLVCKAEERARKVLARKGVKEL